MKKIVKIKPIEPFRIICTFNNDEERILDLRALLDENDKYARQVFDRSVFQQVEVGDLGELYWKDLAEMKDINGDTIKCNYDISPELAYKRSKPLAYSRS